MTVKWKKGYQPQCVVEKIESLRRVDPDGNVKFEGFIFKEYESILFGMMDFVRELPEAEARKILWRSLVTTGTRGIITPKRLITEINKRANKYLQTPVSRYVLLTSLSIQSEDALNRIIIGRDQIIFGNVPSRFYKEAKPLLKKARYSIFSEPPDNYLPVRIHVSSRSIYEAADKALDHLDLIRAIWNLFYNMKQSFRWSVGGKPKPINKIVTGPIHTLHKTNGELSAREIWWYDPSFVEPVQTQNVSQDFDKLNDFMNFIRKQLSKISYSNIVEDALRRYVRSLDERDWNNAYLRLWSVLELLTNTVYDGYDITIRRAAFIFKERDYHFQVLQHLRDYRNRFVHHDTSDSGVESHLYQLKNIVEAILRFHLSNNFQFSSMQEAANFLNSPYERDTLELRYTMSKNALKFRGLE